MVPRHGSPYTAIIADDHELLRTGLKAALESPGVIETEGLCVVAEASDGLEAISLIKTHQPDLLLLDIQMPQASGVEILPDLRRWSPHTKIVIITAVSAPGLLAGIVDAGVDGLFSKASDNTELFETLPLILRGGRHIAEPMVKLLKGTQAPPALTARERQTLNMIVSGRSTPEMAELMGISPRTAEKHRANLMAKMEVNSAVELMSKALKEGLIDQQAL